MKKQWVLRWEQVEIRPEDVTVEDIAAVDALTGCGWRCDPTEGPNVASNLLAVCVARITGEDIRDHLRTLPAAALAAALDYEPLRFDLPAEDSTPVREL